MRGTVAAFDEKKAESQKSLAFSFSPLCPSASLSTPFFPSLSSQSLTAFYFPLSSLPPFLPSSLPPSLPLPFPTPISLISHPPTSNQTQETSTSPPHPPPPSLPSSPPARPHLTFRNLPITPHPTLKPRQHPPNRLNILSSPLTLSVANGISNEKKKKEKPLPCPHLSKPTFPPRKTPFSEKPKGYANTN